MKANEQTQISSHNNNMKVETACSGGRAPRVLAFSPCLSFIFIYHSTVQRLWLHGMLGLRISFCYYCFYFQIRLFCVCFYSICAVICLWCGPEYRLSIKMHWHRSSMPTSPRAAAKLFSHYDFGRLHSLEHSSFSWRMWRMRAKRSRR